MVTNFKLAKFAIMCGIVSSVVFLSSLKAAEVSQDAKRHMFRGEAAMEEAKDASGYQDAVAEFKKAVEYSPDWADAWFNLGVAQESAEDYKGAMKSFNKYLTLNPAAADKSEVEGRIYKLEYKAERKAKDALPKKVKAQETQKVKKPSIAGRWRVDEVNNYKRTSDSFYDITVSGNSFTAKYYEKINGVVNQFNGNINGNSIEGTAIIDHATWWQNGKVWKRPFTGRISSDGNTITVNYRMIDITGATGLRANGFRNYDRNDVWKRY